MLQPSNFLRQWRRLARALVVALGLGFAPLIQAKPLPVPFDSEYQSENWGLEDGFPENSSLGIVAAPDGYLWIGTYRGLVRFNGQAFNKWGPEAMPELRSIGIVTMYRDGAGRIWLSTLDGLVMNSGETWRRWTAADGWDDPLDHVRNFAENAAGQLVLTRFSGRVLRLEGNRFRELPLPPGTGGSFAGLDADGGLYFFRGGRAGWFTDGAWQPIAGEPDLGQRAVGATQSRDGNALIVCRDELLRLRGGRVVSRTRLSQPVAVFWQATEDAAGTLWLPAVEAGVYRIRPDGQVSAFRKADGLPHGGGTRTVHVAEDSSIWIGGGVGGLTRFRSTRFRYLGEEEGMGDREVMTLSVLPDGRMLFAPYGSGLRVFDGVKSMQPFRRGLNLPLYCRTILRTRDGVLWMGAAGAGLFRMDEAGVTRAATEFFAADSKEGVHTLFEDSRGRLWVGGERTLLRQEGTGFVQVVLPVETAGRRPTIFAERRDGSVLLGQHDAIYVYEREGVRPAPLARLPAESRVSTLHVDSRDRVWIGTAGHGLGVYHGERLYTLGNDRGLPGMSIGGILEDDDGRLWFGAGRHVVRADPDELWAAMQEPSRELQILSFDRDDGIRKLDFPFGTQPSVQKDAQGRLWFALIRGAAMIDPRTVKVNARPPPVVIEQISYVPHLARQPVVLSLASRGSGLVLPPGSRMIRIDYAALDYSAPRKQRFRVGLDGEWQDMQGETTVSFLELPAGSHRLHVQAAGSDGVWNRTGATLEFKITPFLWQTAWFRVAAGLAVLGLVAGGVWFVGDRRTRRARESLEREQRLNEAQARLALVLENTVDFVAFADPAGRIVYLNRAGRALIGLDPAADVRAVPLGAILSPAAQRVYNDIALPAALRHGTWSGECALLQRDGGEVPVSQVLIAHRSPAGDLDFTSMIARDISAAKRHESVQDALRQLATALTAALEPPSLGRVVAEACRALFAHDAFFLVLVNEARTIAQTAYVEDTPLGASAPQPMATPIRDMGGRFAAVIEGQPLLVNRDDPAPAAGDGAASPWGATDRQSRSIMYAPVRWEGRTIGVLSLQSYTVRRYGAADLQQLETLANHCAAAIARLNAEARLRRNEEQLRHSQKLEAVGTLAGGIAHDFNNILTAIMGNADLASLELGERHPARDFIAKIRLSSVRARDLVRRILAFSRPRETQRRAMAIDGAVEEVVKLLRSTVPATVDLTVDLDAGAPLVELDPTELHQVLLNLGTNAAHALGDKPGRMQFRVAEFTLSPGIEPPLPQLRPGRYARISVSDTGCGIPPEILPRIFDPFFTTKGAGLGSGLGLSVAHGIVHAHNGVIDVASTVGLGTTFNVYLPASSAPAPAVTEPVRSAALPDSDQARTGRLLIVDDESMIVSALTLMLTRAGHTVASFTSPAEALAAFRADPGAFDLVLTDLSMPEMTGVTLAREIRTLRADLPIILISGYVRGSDGEAARAAGVNRVVEKPITAATLLPIVSRFLPARRAVD